MKNLEKLSKNELLAELREFRKMQQSIVENATKSEKRFHQMFEKHTAIMLLIEPETGKIINANLSAQKFYGYSEKTFKQMIIQDINSLPKKKVLELRKQAQKKNQNYFVFPHRMASGEIRTVEEHSSPILIKKRQLLFSIINDITEQEQAKNKLRDINAKHSAMIKNIGEVIGIVGIDGTTKYQSPNIEKWFGWKPEDLIGTNLWDKMHPEDIERVQIKFNKLLKIKERQTVEYRFKCKDGFYKWIELTAINRINDPAINGVLLNYRDISECKQAKNLFKVSESRFRELVNTINSGVAIYKVINDGKSGSDYIIEDFNKFALSHDDKLKENVIGKSLKDIRPNIDDFGIIDVFRKVWKSGEAEFYPAKIYIDDNFSNFYENRVFKLPSGEIVAVYDDVTEKKKAEEKLKESEERFNLAMTATKDGLYDWNLITNKIYYSPGWKNMLGYKDDELTNDISVWGKLIEAKDAKKSWEMQQELINKQCDRFELEFKMKHKEGHFIEILSRAEAVFDKNGKAIRIVGTHVDISERKQTEIKLKDSRNYLSAIFNNTIDSQILSKSEEGGENFKIVAVNNTYIKKLNQLGFKITEDDLIGKSLKEVTLNILFFGQEVFDYTLNFYKKAIDTQKQIVYNENFIINEKQYHSETLYIPIFNSEDGVNYVLFNSHDITERKLAEGELEKYRKNLENLVKERTEKLETKNKELERFNNLFVDREYRIKELRDQIKKLKK
ncbi:MAG: PAS domain S-box protein [Bacteroidetes bacterium]|nr:PAS domain S-box protein [Bacteroidota bacterium]